MCAEGEAKRATTLPEMKQALYTYITIPKSLRTSKSRSLGKVGLKGTFAECSIACRILRAEGSIACRILRAEGSIACRISMSRGFYSIAEFLRADVL